MANVDTLLAALEKVKKTGADRCPAHADRSPSLSIRYVDNKILLHCFGGCAVDEVVSAIGLTLSDLMPDNPGHHKPVKSRYRHQTYCDLSAMKPKSSCWPLTLSGTAGYYPMAT
ncbi:MAG: hypothetical protein EPN89_14135 [Methylovulum sp.]|nr:MAG: hypothetical protein EPN89_14135 [Methylovulum sp.]